MPVTTPLVAAWAASGAMALSGRRDGGALGPPALLVDGVAALGERIATRSAELGRAVELDWLALLGERAALAGLARAGTTSCGGGTRLLSTADGWMAVALTRPSDLDLLPAWLGVEVVADDPWAPVAARLAAQRSADVLAQATLLGLPVSALGERTPRADAGVHAQPHGPAPPTATLQGVRVVDLSGLWAGPLCASLLGSAGADVIKVESTQRPDGGRRANRRFFDVLNGGKRSVCLDLVSASGRTDLARLVAAADVVVEAARPRALEQLGIVATEVLAGEAGPRVWVSITGHGRASPRVAFGDDAAVAGGLVVDDGSGPCFCADAVADPVTGLAAAAAALDALAQGGRWLLDVAMAGVSAAAAGPTLPAEGLAAAAPRARAPLVPARPFGADTAVVLASL